MLKTTDRVKFEAGGITVVCAPMRYDRMSEAAKFTTFEEGKPRVDFQAQCFHVVKHSVKEILGVHDTAGKPIVLELEPGGGLTDEATQDALAIISRMDRLLSNVIRVGNQNVPPLVDALEGGLIEGVKVIILAKDGSEYVPGEQKAVQESPESASSTESSPSPN